MLLFNMRSQETRVHNPSSLGAFIPAQQGVPRYERAACPSTDLPAEEHIECGYLIVPEDRQQAGSQTIRLAVAILKSHSSIPASDPVVYLAGGPGDSALDEAIFLRQLSLRDS